MSSVDSSHHHDDKSDDDDHDDDDHASPTNNNKDNKRKVSSDTDDRIELLSYSSATEKHFQNCNAAVLPLRPHSTWYSKIRKSDIASSLSALAVLQKRNLGCIIATLDEKDDTTVVLATLAVYIDERLRGVGRKLVQHVQDHLPANVRRIIIHVHTGNDDATAFYERLGFVHVETIPNYYRHLKPSSCELYEKQTKPSDKVEPKTENAS